MRLREHALWFAIGLLCSIFLLTQVAAIGVGPATKITTVRKTADETVNNSATLQNDDVLLLAMAANETWYFTVSLAYLGNTTSDFQWAFTVPTGATLRWGCSPVKQNISGLMVQCDSVTGSGTGDTVQADTTHMQLTVHGVVVNGGTAGNLQLQWAQATATVVDTIVRVNSYLEAHK